ncbi:MAG: hypothetical protein DRJ52_11005 [Thermoprotei archaeon]|nr:MAG: hypothetical protein DRJ52_11005 [Thermoprotei archaeon]
MIKVCPVFYKPAAVITVRIKFARSFTIKDYTSKLVKTSLIQADSKLEDIFAKGRDLPPKPIHITPLYTIEKKRGKRAIYAHVIAKGSTAKPPSVENIKPVTIKANKNYVFYIGSSVALLDTILSALLNLGTVVFGQEIVEISDVDYTVNYIDVDKESEKIKNKLEEICDKKEESTSKLKIVFESPTVLKDPLVIRRKKKKKILLPLPEAILSTPLLMTLVQRGLYKKTLFLRLSRYIKSIFDIPYTALKTVNLTWYVYNNKPLPALIGYIAYFIDCSILNHAQARINIKYRLNLLNLLSEAIVLAQVYGVGNGRAAGFGHISIRLINFPSSRLIDEEELQQKIPEENIQTKTLK